MPPEGQSDNCLKTVANHFVKQIWMVCFCFALAAISAHGQVGGGLIAYNITFNGNSVTCDSFDSSDANHSIWQTNLFYHGVNYGIWSNGLGYDPNSPPSRTANCHVATLNGLVDVGAARIYGYINTTPGGTYTIKNQGSVGDLDWVHNGISGVQSGHFRDSVNQTFPSFPLPTTFSNAYQINKWLPVPSAGPGTNIIKIGGMWTNIAGTWTNKGGLFYTNKSGSGWAIPYTNGYVYKTVITNRPPDTNSPYIYYTMNSISSSNLFIDAPYVVLYVTNGMSSPILTLNTNADAIIYSGGDITFALGGAINNNSKLAGALTIDDIQGRPISINASGNAITYAKLYVPGSSIVLNGGGKTTYDVIGQITAYSVEFNGHFNFHFDESLTPHSPPVIVSQSTDETVYVGQTAYFTVNVSGYPLNYQWTFNGTNISGATGSSLVLTNVQLDQAGNYAVQVTNSLGSAVSSNAVLTVIAQPPIILTQPTNRTVWLSDATTFNVAVTGSLPLGYQWNFNGTNIDSATNSTLTLSNIQLTNAGSYSVTISNAFGVTNSDSAVLTVNPITCVAPPSGLVVWWQAEGNANDNVGTNNASLMGGTSFDTGKVGQAFDFNGSNAYVLVPSSPSIKPTGPFTVEAWVNYQGFASGQTGDAIVAKGQDVEGPIDWAMSIGSTKKFRVHLHMGSNWDQFDGPMILNTNTWYHVAMVYDGTNLLAYVNGTPDGSQAVPGALQATDYPLKIGAYSPTNGIQSKDWFYGQIDEVSIYNRALSTGEIQAIYNARGEGKCLSSMPVILSQPSDQIVLAGRSPAFTVVANGTPSLIYQWNFNGANLDGATGAVLTLTNVWLTDAGDYSVIITNVFGSVTSSPANLIVYTNAAATLNTASVSNGQFQFNISGVTGLNYAIQTSSNLVDWNSLMTNVSPFSFTTNVDNLPNQFYRAVYFP